MFALTYTFSIYINRAQHSETGTSIPHVAQKRGAAGFLLCRYKDSVFFNATESAFYVAYLHSKINAHITRNIPKMGYSRPSFVSS